MRWSAFLIVLILAHLALLIPWSQSRQPRGDLVFISAQEHNFLDPQKISWTHDVRVEECIFEPLVRFKLPEMTLEPAAAESWEVSPDGVTYTFHLRTEARWSNGDPVTARDFIYAWRRAMMPDLAADYSELMFRIRGAEVFFNHRNEALKAYVSGSDHGQKQVEKVLQNTYQELRSNRRSARPRRPHPGRHAGQADRLFSRPLLVRDFFPGAPRQRRRERDA